MTHSVAYTALRIVRHALFACCTTCICTMASAQVADPKAAKFYEDALIRYEKKDLDGAIIQLRNALQVDRSQLAVHLLLGKALMENGSVAAAEVAFGDALRLGVNRSEIVVPMAQALIAQGKQREFLDRPDFSPGGLPVGIRVQLLVLRAASLADLTDYKGALAAIGEARGLDPRSAATALAEVSVRLRSGQTREAAAALERAMALSPDSAETHYYHGAVLHAMGDQAGALAAYNKVLALEPRNSEARVSRAGLLIDLGQSKEAARDVEELLRAQSRDPRAVYMKALLAERDGKQEAALAALKEMTALIDPVPMDFIRYRPQLLMLNGLAHYALGSRERATVYLEAFQRLQNHSPATKLLAQLYVADSRADKAADVLEAYLRARPDDAQAMILLASALMSRGQDARAASLMTKALERRDVPEFRTVLGLSLLRSGQTGNALDVLENTVKRDPKQVIPAMSLAGLYLAGGQNRKAIALIEKLSVAHPGNAHVFNMLGMAKRRSGDIKGATTAFEKSASLDPTVLEPRLNLARIDVAARRYDSARERIKGLLKAKEKFPEAMFELSLIEELQGHHEETLRWLERAQEAAPDDPRWGLAQVEYHLRHGQASPAVEVAKRVASRSLNELVVLITLARAQVAAGDNSGAQNSLSNATRLAEYRADAQVRIALLQQAAGNLPGAAYSLGKALTTQPDYLPALALMVEIELRQGDLAAAEHRARSIAAKFPRRAIGASLLGDIAVARRDRAAALEHYRRAHAIEPSNDSLKRLARALATEQGPGAVQKLLVDWARTHPKDLFARRAVGDAYAAAGNFKAARSAYEEALKLAPNDAEILNNLANTLIRLGDPTALQAAEKAVAASPGNPGFVDTVGWIMFQQGKTDAALQRLRDARLRAPGNAEIRYHLAAVLAKAGRKTEARMELDAALGMNRSFDGVDQALDLAKTLATSP